MNVDTESLLTIQLPVTQTQLIKMQMAITCYPLVTPAVYLRYLAQMDLSYGR
jgi:hypothetical protein